MGGRGGSGGEIGDEAGGGGGDTVGRELDEGQTKSRKSTNS
jgi:hypothetical protein